MIHKSAQSQPQTKSKTKESKESKTTQVNRMEMVPGQPMELPGHPGRMPKESSKLPRRIISVYYWMLKASG